MPKSVKAGGYFDDVSSIFHRFPSRTAFPPRATFRAAPAIPLGPRRFRVTERSPAQSPKAGTPGRCRDHGRIMWDLCIMYMMCIYIYMYIYIYMECMCVYIYIYLYRIIYIYVCIYVYTVYTIIYIIDDECMRLADIWSYLKDQWDIPEPGKSSNKMEYIQYMYN